MLLPRYSLRQILAVMVIVALVFVAAAQAARGAAWAVGITIAVATLLVSLGVYALTFLPIWLFAVPYQAWRQRRRGASPFEDLPEPLLAGEPVLAGRGVGSRVGKAGAEGPRDPPLDPAAGPEWGGSLPGGSLPGGEGAHGQGPLNSA